MKNIELKLKKLGNLMNRAHLISLLLMFALYGCLPVRSAWEGDKDQFVNKKLDPELVLTKGSYGAKYGSYFFGWSKDMQFDQVVSEGKKYKVLHNLWWSL